jgi:hypothetical protein
MSGNWHDWKVKPMFLLQVAWFKLVDELHGLFGSGSGKGAWDKVSST